VTDGSAPTAVTRLELHEVILREAAQPYQAIADACLRFEQPVDIEWIWHDEAGLQLLQVRPITGVRRFAPENRELAQYALPVPEPVSRLGASLDFERNAIYQDMVRRLTTARFRARMLGVYGQLYGVSQEHEPAPGSRVAAGVLLGLVHAIPYLLKRRRLLQPVERRGSAREALLQGVRDSQSFYRTSIYVGTLYN
jgi:hypothetical protein